MNTLNNRQAAEELQRRVRAITPATQRRWGKMTAHEMLCHLRDAYECGFGEKTASDATGLFQQTVMKWGALYFPAPWPKGVPTRPEMEQGVGGTPPVRFEEDRNRLLAIIDRFSRDAQALEGKQHPIFGAMTAAEWQRWGWLHADHHLRQFGA